MKKFEERFEAAKIPEFYNFYFDYRKIKDEIRVAKTNIQSKLMNSHLL